MMPDALNPPAAGGATASIIIRKDGAAQPPISWRDSGRPDPTMSAISVFDKECASVHVQEKSLPKAQGKADRRTAWRNPAVPIVMLYEAVSALRPSKAHRLRETVDT